MKVISYQKNNSITSFLPSNKPMRPVIMQNLIKLQNEQIEEKKSIQFCVETLSKPLKSPSINYNIENNQLHFLSKLLN